MISNIFPYFDLKVVSLVKKHEIIIAEIQVAILYTLNKYRHTSIIKKGKK